MSSWKSPLFALALVTIMGTASYAEDAPATQATPSAEPAVAVQAPPAVETPAPAVAKEESAAPEEKKSSKERRKSRKKETTDKSKSPKNDGMDAMRSERREQRQMMMSPDMRAEFQKRQMEMIETMTKIRAMNPAERAEASKVIVGWFEKLPLEKQTEIKSMIEMRALMEEKFKHGKGMAPVVPADSASTPATETTPVAPASAPVPAPEQGTVVPAAPPAEPAAPAPAQ